ncbi:hypothetical protein P692DRAFT_201795910 [Suillus brevipes Sb2]|nr:hypothetical protein P692DRAFT_201795910 [Suillus brevipes Sb2]
MESSASPKMINLTKRVGRRHNDLRHKQKLPIALENYRFWTVPTFTTYLHSCVMHTMAINTSLDDQMPASYRYPILHVRFLGGFS